MKIQCTTTFLDGTDRFENGDVRTVEDERGARFVAAGWATDLAGRVATGDAFEGETTLDIQNVKMGQEATHG